MVQIVPAFCQVLRQRNLEPPLSVEAVRLDCEHERRAICAPQRALGSRRNELLRTPYVEGDQIAPSSPRRSRYSPSVTGVARYSTAVDPLHRNSEVQPRPVASRGARSATIGRVAPVTPARFVVTHT